MALLRQFVLAQCVTFDQPALCQTGAACGYFCPEQPAAGSRMCH